MIELSLVIPTYNRAPILARCLHLLAQQTVAASRFEVIVVDDGSTDQTLDRLDQLQHTLPFSLIYQQQRHQGPAAARNRAIRRARGDLILLLGDDILATPTLLERHLAAHARQQDSCIAMLGRIDWSPDLPITPLMRYITRKRQFGYDLIDDPANVTARFFYSSNLSLRRTTLLKYGMFDEEFPAAAYEDLELGYRLERQGLRLMYDAEALAYHYHPTTLQSFMRREAIAGRSLLIFHRKWPDAIPLAPHLPRSARDHLRWWLKRLIVPGARWLAIQLDRARLHLPGTEHLYRFVLDNTVSFSVQHALKESSHA